MKGFSSMLSKLFRYTTVFFYYLLLKPLPSRSSCPFCVKLRTFFLKFLFKSVGQNVNVATGVRFGLGGKISIGDNSGLGENCYIVAMDEVKIGSDVMIAPEVMILTGNHDFEDPNLLLRLQKTLTKPVSIGNDCWVGARAVILPGVSICDRVIVAAGAVVTKSIVEPGIYGGNPARKIKRIPV